MYWRNRDVRFYIEIYCQRRICSFLVRKVQKTKLSLPTIWVLCSMFEASERSLCFRNLSYIKELQVADFGIKVDQIPGASSGLTNDQSSNISVQSNPQIHSWFSAEPVFQPSPVNGLCKLLNQNRETLTSLELIHCKLSSTSINSICDALLHNRKTHGILHFSINASYFDETNPVALPFGLVSFLSSGRHLYSFKLCENDLGKNFGKLVFHTLLDASSCLSVLDLSENDMAGWLSNFNRRSFTGITAFSVIGKSLQSLRVLNLRGNELRKDDADNLRYALAHIPNLEFLDISDNPIEDDGIRNLIPYLIEASEKSFPFADLNLESCELSSDGVTQLLNVLSTLKKPLRSLSVADNSLGSSVAAALGVFMRKSIQILNVEGIDLGPCGFQDLSEGLTEGSNIVNINISKNRGGKEVANFLLKLLPGASNLVSVNASYNLMPVESLEIVHSALKIAKGKLELLNLRGHIWDYHKDKGSLFEEFQNSGRKILIYSESPTLDGLYDNDP